MLCVYYLDWAQQDIKKKKNKEKKTNSEQGAYRGFIVPAAKYDVISAGRQVVCCNLVSCAKKTDEL